MNVMEFGDKEWLKKVEQHYNFPTVIAFYITNKKKTIQSTIVNSNPRNVGDIKYSRISPKVTLFNGEKLALLEVRRIHNAEEYYEVSKRLNQDWS